MSNTHSSNNKRIAKNTLMLYFRTIITMVVSLYTSRVVLEALGVEDYGIYNVVGGLVAMFSILSRSLTGAISRFITFELGRGDADRLKSVFSTSLNVQLIISILVVIAVEIVGLWFLNNELNIPPDRLDAARIVLHISMLTFLVNLISVPYNAAIIAHEKMGVFAYISLLQVSLKLGVVYLLGIATYDKLIVYTLLILAVDLVIRSIYSIYCRRNFAECSYHFILDKPLLKEIFSFAGWNFIGSTANLLKNQGVNMMLNIFFGAAVNAARGVAMQVNTAVTSFVNNFMTAVNPQITKSYATGDHSYMMQLIFNSSRYGFYLMLLLSMPIMLETPKILSIWLTVTPDHTVNFVRLVLIYSLVQVLSQPLITAMLATGNIRNYHIVVGGLNLLCTPISYLFLELGFSAESTFVVTIVMSFMTLLARIYMLRGMIHISAISYIKEVVFNTALVAVVAFIVPFALLSVMPEGLLRFFSVAIVSLISVILTTYFLGLNVAQRQSAMKFVSKKLSKFSR